MDRQSLHDLMKAPDKSEKNLAMLAHLLTLFGFLIPGVNLLVPLLIWLNKRESSAFVEQHARESLKFQITMTLLAAIWAALNAVLIGLLLLPIAGIIVIMALIFIIRAAMKASSGDDYQYPLCIRLVS